MNSARAPWLLVVVANDAGFRIRTEHSEAGNAQDQVFRPDQKGSFLLWPHSVYSIAPLDEAPCDCEIRFNLLDEQGTRPMGGYLSYSASALRRRLGDAETSLEYYCLDSERCCVTPVLRQPTRTAVHIIEDAGRRVMLQPRTGRVVSRLKISLMAARTRGRTPAGRKSWFMVALWRRPRVMAWGFLPQAHDPLSHWRGRLSLTQIKSGLIFLIAASDTWLAALVQVIPADYRQLPE